MTARRFYKIACDASDCLAEFSTGDDRADHTRSKARLAGWVYGVEHRTSNQGPIRSFDFCSEHAHLLPEQTAPEPPECRDNCPKWWPMHWREWHRGHGCNKDDGQPRSPGAAELIGRGG